MDLEKLRGVTAVENIMKLYSKIKKRHAKQFLIPSCWAGTYFTSLSLLQRAINDFENTVVPGRYVFARGCNRKVKNVNFDYLSVQEIKQAWKLPSRSFSRGRILVGATADLECGYRVYFNGSDYTPLSQDGLIKYYLDNKDYFFGHLKKWDVGPAFTLQEIIDGKKVFDECGHFTKEHSELLKTLTDEWYNSRREVSKWEG